jgi:hypothetical protein
MALQDTNLLLQVGKLPLRFRGTPQQFADEIVHRSKIVSPSGVSFIFTGDVEPSSNVGPWFRTDGSIYIFDDVTKRYIPLNITASEVHWFWTGPDAPPSSTPAIWLKTFAGGTTDAPNTGQPVGFYQFNGTSWVPVGVVTLSGSTASRPGAPFDLQQYYDTDIACLIWYERGSWRTVAGTPGDVKASIISTLTEALRFNPGWEVLGASNAQVRGRIVMQACKDPGGSPETSLTPPAGVASRAAGETFGETDGVDTGAFAVPYPPQYALWHLVKL